MNRFFSADRLLTVFLVLGGVPPMLFGFFAMFFGEAYFHFIGSGVAQSLGHGQGFAIFLGNLQGGDAFVAGSCRLAAAFLGSLNLKRIFAAIGIFHSGFELWLLPTKLLTWCKTTPAAACSDLFYVELYFFLGLHGLLVLGFATGIVLSFRSTATS